MPMSGRFYLSFYGTNIHDFITARVDFEILYSVLFKFLVWNKINIVYDVTICTKKHDLHFNPQFRLLFNFLSIGSFLKRVEFLEFL